MNDLLNEIRNSDEESLKSLFISLHGAPPIQMTPLPGSGGKRRYYRLSNGDISVIGCAGTNQAENMAFINLCNHLGLMGACVPKIMSVSGDYMYYLQTDLGEVSLADCLKSPHIGDYVRKTLYGLVKMQTVPRILWERDCDYGAFNRRQIMWDLNYFKYEYLKPMGVELNEDRLEDDFEHFAEMLLDMASQMSGFMMRDCQSRNVMIYNDTPYFIDVQGGRPGPCVYDAVSLLWQAKARFSDEFRQEMMDFYAQHLAVAIDLPREAILETVPEFALFRTLQVLGAYGLRGLVERKQHFIDSIPYALANLKALAEQGVLEEYPELCRIAVEISSDSVKTI